MSTSADAGRLVRGGQKRTEDPHDNSQEGFPDAKSGLREKGGRILKNIKRKKGGG